jgi:hypothetical protein
MSKNANSSQKTSGDKWYADRSVQLALLGVGGTIIAAIITILPQYLGGSRQPEPTQTAIIWTATAQELSTATQEPILPTETLTPGPTDTATPSPTPTPITPPLSCLDRWQVISSNPDLIETGGAGDCAVSNAPALGISASKSGIGIGINNFREQGTFGIATLLPTDATITLDINLTVLTQGEFWVALSNTPTPENNMLIFAVQPKDGEVRIYNDQITKFSQNYKYKDLITNTVYSSGPPFIYQIILETSGNRVSPQIHYTNIPSQTVNLPKYLFIGYNNKSTLGSMSLQVEISNLTVEVE